MKKKIPFFIILLCCSLFCAFGLTACVEVNSQTGHTHAYSERWSYNSSEHWHECSCGDKKDIAKHYLKNGVCDVCGFEDGSSVIPDDPTPDNPTEQCKHEKIIHVTDENEASCTDEGYSLDIYVCASYFNEDGKRSVCGRIFADERGIKNNDPIGRITGVYDLEYFCQDPGNFYEYYQTLPKLPHTPVIDAAVPPTCVKKGLTEGSHCGVCNTVIKAQEETVYADHAYTDKVTFLDNGEETHNVCSVCGQIENDSRILKTRLNEGNGSYTVAEAQGGWTSIAFDLINYNDMPITGVGDRAFYGCRALSSVDLNGIESVGSSAFAECGNLTDIVIPDGLTDIDNGMFYNCPIENATIPAYACRYVSNPNIKNVEITSGESIANYVFQDCAELTRVIIPDTVTSIGKHSFSACVGLTEINIPQSVTSIDDFSFFGCGGLESITVESGNANYHSDGNCLIETESGKLVLGCKNSVIPSDGSVEVIGLSFVNCNGLTSIVIPDCITRISDNAFSGCHIENATIPSSACEYIKNANLKSVVITSGESISGYALSGCAELTDITIPDTVTSIGYSAFNGCPIENASVPSIACEYIKNANLKTVSITSGDRIGYDAFSDCENLTSVTVADGLTYIGNRAFRGCGNLKSLFIPDSVRTIDSGALDGCDSLEYNEYDNALYLGNTQNLYAVLIKAAGKDITSCEINSAAKYIYENAFSGCGSLKTIVIPNSVNVNNYSVFSGCSAIENVTAPLSAARLIVHESENSLKTLVLTSGDSIEGTFYNCTSLTSITIPESVKSISGGAFGNCPIENATVPAFAVSYLPKTKLSAVTVISGDSIDSRAFSDCVNLRSITLADTVTSIVKRAFSDCESLESITVASGNPVYHSDGNCLIETSSKTLVAGCGSSVIPSDGSVKSIGTEAFGGCKNLTSITVPDGVTDIGYYAFSSCAALTSVKIADSVTSVDNNAFNSCHIETAEIPSIAAVAIGNANLKTVVITSGDSIVSGAFSECGNLTSIFIPDSVTAIGESVFSGCNSLESITVASGNAKYHSDGNCLIETSGKILAAGCKASVIPDDGSVTSIGPTAFYGLKSLKNISIPSKITSIGESAFYLSGLTEIVIPDSVESIGARAFWQCSDLSSANIGKGVKIIGQAAFNSCGKLKEIKIGDGVTSIESSVFTGCPIEKATVPSIACASIAKGNNMLQTVIITSGDSIANDAFYNCKNLTSVTIPNTVKSIGNYVFQNCVKLTKLVIPEGVTSIGSSAFSNCTSLETVSIPNSITKIGGSAFKGCDVLQYKVDNNVLYLGNSVNPYAALIKANDTSITSCDINAETKYIYLTAFSGCSSLKTFNYLGDLAGWCGISGLENAITSSRDNFLINGMKPAGDVTIPDGVTSIGANAFYHCSGITSITIPNSVKSIGASAFSGCSGIASVVIPDGVKTLEKNVFWGCTALTSVTLPDGLTSIGDDAFYTCKNLTSIAIPDSVQSIGAHAFWLCEKLSNVTIPDGVETIGTYTFYGCAITSMVIPDSVTEIHSDAFFDCAKLTKVTIGKNVKSIATGAFSYCVKLTDITYNGTVEEWELMTREADWNKNTGNYTVHCTDGDVAKA